MNALKEMLSVVTGLIVALAYLTGCGTLREASSTDTGADASDAGSSDGASKKDSGRSDGGPSDTGPGDNSGDGGLGDSGSFEIAPDTGSAETGVSSESD